MRRTSRLTALLFLAVLAGCRGPHQAYTSFGAGAPALKQQFNADAGKTRILILPAPT